MTLRITMVWITQCRNAECRNVECRYAECRYAECRHAERHDTIHSKVFVSSAEKNNLCINCLF
jgi:hypothetical protein